MAPPKRTVLLDLDHTLIHSLPKRVSDKVPMFEMVLGKEVYCVHVRPFALEFLTFLMKQSDFMRFGFWTAATEEYAHAVVTGLFKLLLVDDWTPFVATVQSRKLAVPLAGGLYLKDLRRIHKILGTRDIVLLDDDPIHTKCRGNLGRVVTVPAYNAYSRRTDTFFECFARGLEHEKKIDTRCDTIPDSMDGHREACLVEA